jgi:hypothetical protein
MTVDEQFALIDRLEAACGNLPAPAGPYTLEFQARRLLGLAAAGKAVLDDADRRELEAIDRQALAAEVTVRARGFRTQVIVLDYARHMGTRANAEVDVWCHQETGVEIEVECPDDASFFPQDLRVSPDTAGRLGMRRR